MLAKMLDREHESRVLKKSLAARLWA